jgi:hypothetical protein
VQLVLDRQRDVGVGRQDGARYAVLQGLLDDVRERVGVADLLVLEERLAGREQAALGGGGHLVLVVAQALGRLEGELLLLRVARHAQVDAAEGHAGGLARIDAGIGRVAEVLGGLRVLGDRRVDERVVDHEGQVAAAERVVTRVLLVVADRGRPSLARDPLHDARGLDPG